jgi:hypothetical protein
MFFNLILDTLRALELCCLNLKLYSEQYNKIDLLHLIVMPQLSGGWQHN